MARRFGDRWEVERDLQAGGQGWTYVVRDVTGAEPARCVLKRLKNVDRIARFEDEVQAIRVLSHVNVIRLIDSDIKSETPYFVSEYCEGGNLTAHCDRWKGDPADTLDMFAQVCDGVAAGHLSNPPIVHRDIKPENVLLRSAAGPLVVGDFGICYIMDDGERVTLTEEAAGSRYFMAPELADGRADAVYPAADVYSLGKLIYWMLSGGRKFDREGHRRDDRNLVGSDGEHPECEHVNRLLDKMIVQDWTQRFLNARQVAGAARFVADLIRRGAPPMGADFKLPCTFCKQGRYNEAPLETTPQRTNSGLGVGGGFRWRALTCDQCGHVQIFNVDHAAQRDAWWPNRPL